MQNLHIIIMETHFRISLHFHANKHPPEAHFLFHQFARTPWQLPSKTLGTMHTARKYFIMNQTFQLVNTEKLSMKINQHSKPKKITTANVKYLKPDFTNQIRV